MPKRFDHDLCALEDRLVHMGRMVEEMISNAQRGFSEWSLGPFSANLKIEDEIDSMQAEVDEETVRLIAIYTPVAVDLRHLLMITRINAELERVADQIINIGFYSKQMFRESAITPMSAIPRMAEMGRGMLREAMDSFKDEDKQGVIAVIKRDDEVDELHDRVFTELMAFAKANPSALKQTMELVLTARAFERIADHAVNIAEDVYFIIEGYDIRHRGAELP
jgi:phosphate transport system protein